MVTPNGESIRGGPFGALDDQTIQRGLGGIRSKAELLLNRGEERWGAGVCGCVGIEGSEVHLKVEPASESGSIYVDIHNRPGTTT